MPRLFLSLLLILTFGCRQQATSRSVGDVAQAAEPKAIPQCTTEQMLALAPSRMEIERHRQFEVPTIDYAAGTEKDTWGVDVALRIGVEGKPECYGLLDRFGQDVAIDTERATFLAGIGSWRYTPFFRDGQAAPAIVTESVREQKLPETHVPLPDVPLSEVSISLGRSGCFGTCPRYLVTVRGDGTASYTGDSYVDVQGEHHYRVPPEEVADLVASLREKDLWSMDSEYRAPITDNPTYQVIIRMGGESRQIIDYVGEMAGMPVVISEFEREVDRVARSDQWVSLGALAVEQLEKEEFQFESQEGADLLARAVSNRKGDDKAIARLIELGAPIRGGDAYGFLGRQEVDALEAALRNQRLGAIASLIAAGALETKGRLDQKRLDAAFRAAVAGGSLAAVEQIWEGGRQGIRPALVFRDEGEIDDKAVYKEAPVLLLLEPYAARNGNWEGIAIARWFAAKGVDLNAARASGRTLLHIAAKANDLAFVSYLLEQGLDPSAPGEFGLPALGSTQDEDVALLLLKAGTDVRPLNDDGRPFIDYARQSHWGRVVTWLEQAGG